MPAWRKLAFLKSAERDVLPAGSSPPWKPQLWQSP